MARLITKFKYIKSGDEKTVSGYVKYIATREGVEKIDESFKLKPATKRQQQLINKILKDFPDAEDMHEYEDYKINKTVGTASEFITRALEDNSYGTMNNKTYADYIATRPRAERFGTHGLFTNDGEQVVLSKVSEELKSYDGNVWTVIISLRREDAERLGFNNGSRWRDMLRSQTDMLAQNFKVPMENLCWYAAFHNESHHPHVHLIVYSTDEKEAFLTKKGVENIRSAYAREIFKDELYSVYEKQTERRDDLRRDSKTIIADIIEHINLGTYDNPVLEDKLLLLAEKLKTTKGKKVYGYLKPELKALIISIVDELAKDERISKLYDLWYEQRENVLKTYTSNLPKRVALSDNTEFKTIRNAVITEAMNIAFEKMPMDEPDDMDAPDIEPTDYETEQISFKEKTSKMWNAYFEAKKLLKEDEETYNPEQAVKFLIEAADLGCSVAKYKLGKMFLKGEHTVKNVTYGLQWLEDAVEDENSYAEYLLGKTLLYGNDAELDIERGEELLKKSAEHHNAYAWYTLGKEQLSGELLPMNVEEAIINLTLSAEQRFDVAEYFLGKLYYKGEYVKRDIKQAIDYLIASAEQNNQYAAYLLGKIFATEETVKDMEKALRYFKIAAEEGNAFAEFQLGKIFLYGKGVPRDYHKAVEYLESSAEKGNVYAEQMLKNIRKSRSWSASSGAIRLLYHASRALQKRMEKDRKGGSAILESKLKRQIDEKKKAQGIRQ